MGVDIEQSKFKNLKEPHWASANDQRFGLGGGVQTRSLGFSLFGSKVNGGLLY